jgi:hypothetical protein
MRETDRPEIIFCFKLMLLDILVKESYDLIDKNTHINC